MSENQKLTFRPILFTDFNTMKPGKPISADRGFWILRVGQEVTLAEHGDTVHCDGVVVDPNAFVGPLTKARYARVEIVPDTWDYYDEAIA